MGDLNGDGEPDLVSTNADANTISVLLGTIGGVAMWSVVVVLPAGQAEFQAARAAASLPYTALVTGFKQERRP